MNKFALCAALMLSFTGLVACGSDPDPKIVDDGTGKDWELQAGPNWYENREDEKSGFIYSYGQSMGERNPSLARDSAKANAQDEMAQYLSTKIKSMLDRYASSVAEGGTAVESRLTEQLTRRIVDQELNGFKFERQQTLGKYYYTRGYISSEGLKKALTESAEVKKLVEESVRGKKERFADIMERETKSILDDAANREGPSLK
ncbi:MAG: hypothetical protein KDB07_08630 [Planctomycetes bacterium]|nr:hypothetical protein [Planctomycetota bacterium]